MDIVLLNNTQTHLPFASSGTNGVLLLVVAASDAAIAAGGVIVEPRVVACICSLQGTFGLKGTKHRPPSMPVVVVK